VTDPYAPFPAARPPAFPRERLGRAGLDEGRVDTLADEYEQLDPAARRDLARFVTANSDDVIRERYADQQSTVAAQHPPDTGEQEPPAPQPASTPTYEDLAALTIDQLDDRIREWNDAHPQQHLAIAGRKGEKIGRLLDAYEGERDAATQAPADAAPESAPVAEQQLPTAPTPTTTAGAPEAAPAAPVAPPGTVEAGDAPAGAQEPAQTADAAPGAGTATTEE
jgi:hypothetical protein